MAIVALPAIAAFLAAMAGLLGWPLALGLLPTAAGWLRWRGLTVERARRGRRWGALGYLGMLALGGLQVAVVRIADATLTFERIPPAAFLLVAGLLHTATVGLAAATVAGAVLGCFAGGTKNQEP